MSPYGARWKDLAKAGDVRCEAELAAEVQEYYCGVCKGPLAD